MKKTTLLILCALLCLSLAACGTAAAPAPTPEPTAAPAPEPTPVPTPEPTPFVEPVTVPDCPVTFDGKELPGGSVMIGDVRYVRLSEVAEALGLDLQHEEGSPEFRFPWRHGEVSLSAESAALRYLDADTALETAPVLYDEGKGLYVPLRSFCEGAQIGYFYDEEYDHLYCTPAAGDWAVPEGYDVALMMYHGVGPWPPEANLFVDPEDMEKQIVYLLDNGYTPIWFEDLEHIEDFEKPVLLTFDDGWENTYYYLMPLLEKYQVKATTFIITGDIGRYPGNKLDLDMVKEMDQSGLMSIQSHTVSHSELTYLSEEARREEFELSKLYIIRNLGKEPYALSYPIGASDPDVESVAAEYYRFAVKMGGKTPYNTSENPMLMYRFFPQRQTPLSEYAGWLSSCFGPDAVTD